MEHSDHVGGALYRHPRRAGAAVARRSAQARAGGIRRCACEDRTLVHLRVAGHSHPAVRLPRSGHPEATTDYCHVGGSDLDSSTVQLRARLLAQSPRWRVPQRGLPIGANWCVQFLRACRGRGHQPFWVQFRGRTRHGGRRVDRGACHAARRQGGQCEQRLVRGRPRCARQRRRGPMNSQPIAVTIYHNPACGTSRNTLALIRNANVEPTIIEYLKSPPDRTTLQGLVQRMGIGPRALLREKGTPYAELGLGAAHWTDDELIDQMLAHPILINRPIVITPWRVKLCRPSEAVLDILPLPQRGPFAKEDGELVIDAQGKRVF